MEPTDLTIEILKGIRDDLRATNARLDEHIARTDQRIAQNEAHMQRVDRRLVESEMRVATAITGLSGQLQSVHDLLKTSLELRPRVEKCEQDIEFLKARLPNA